MTAFRNTYTGEIVHTPDADRFTDNRCSFVWVAVSADGPPILPGPSAQSGAVKPRHWLIVMARVMVGMTADPTCTCGAIDGDCPWRSQRHSCPPHNLSLNLGTLGKTQIAEQIEREK